MKSFKSFVPRVALCAGLALAGTAAHAGIPVVNGGAIDQAMWEYTSALHQSAARDAFQRLWESTVGYGSWDSNPWVWALDRSAGPLPPRCAPIVTNSRCPSNP